MVEMLVTLVIFGILASIAVPLFLKQRDVTVDNSIKNTLSSAAIVLQQEKTSGNGVYPAVLPTSVTAPDNMVLTYTHNSDSTAYCLRATQAGKTLYLQSKGVAPTNVNDAPYVITTNNCTYSTTGPSKPTLAGSLKPDNTPVLTWQAVGDAAQYQVWQNGAIVATVTGTTWTGPAPLTAETKYILYAVDGTNNKGPASNEIALRPTKIRPTNAPQVELLNVNGNNVTNTGTLTWTPVTWAEEYRVYNADTGQILWSGTTYSLDISANVGENLKVYVVGLNSVGAGPQSSIVMLSGPLPGSPTLSATLTNQVITGRTYLFNWTNIPGATTYNLYKNGVLIKPGAVSGGTSDTTGWGQASIKYVIKPVGKDGREGIASNEVTVNTIPPTPSTPTGLTLTRSGGTVTAKWNDTTYTSEYSVQYYYNGGAVTDKRVAYPNLTTTLPISVGQTLTVYVYAINYPKTGNSPAAIASISYSLLPPSTFNGAVNPTGSSLGASCAVGTPRYRVRDDAGTPGTFGTWSAFTARTGATASATHNSAWGQATNVQWEVQCFDPTTGAVSDTTSNWNPTLPVRTIPNPVATNWEFSGPDWNGSYTVMGTRLVVTTMCPAGTTLQWQYRDQMSDWGGTWNGWWGWSNAPSADRSGWGTAGIPWGTQANVQMNIRCAAGNAVSAVNGPHGPIGRYSAVAQPSGTFIYLEAWHQVHFGSYCPGGLTTWNDWSVYTNAWGWASGRTPWEGRYYRGESNGWGGGGGRLINSAFCQAPNGVTGPRQDASGGY